MIGHITPEEVEAWSDKFDVSCAEMGAIFGVSASEAYCWETGRRCPSKFTAELIKLGLRVTEEKANSLELDRLLLRKGALKTFAAYVAAVEDVL